MTKIIPPAPTAPQPAATAESASSRAKQKPADDPLREAFDQFVGQTFYGEMLKAMRLTQGKPAYFHGGRAEETFRAQLDQTLAEHLSDATAHQITGPMYASFRLPRPQ